MDRRVIRPSRGFHMASFSERDNKKSILLKAQEEIDFLRHQVSDLEKSSDEERIAWWTKRNKDHDKAEEEMKKRDKQINALHQSLLAQKEENERMRASIDDLKVLSVPKDTEEWQKKISHLEKLITEKDAEITRITKKRRARTNMYLDTLAELTGTQIDLEQAKMTCQALEEKLKNELAVSENRFRKELLKSEKSFRKELSETQIEHGKEVFILNDTWEWKARQWEEEKEKLERSQSVRQRLWTQKQALRKEEIRCLKEQNTKLQELKTQVTPKILKSSGADDLI